MDHSVPPRWWVWPLLIFIVSQAFATVILAEAKSSQEAIPFGDENQYFVPGAPADPPWEKYVTSWNGNAYRAIAEEGYPSFVPRDKDGATVPTPWAFFPLYPLTVKAVMASGLDFGYAAVLTSLSFGLLALLLFYRLLYSYSGRKSVALVGVGTLALWPTAPLFQLAYAESMALVFVISLLMALQKKKYILAAAFVLLLGLTRPVGPPDLALVLLHGLTMVWPRFKASGLASTVKTGMTSSSFYRWAGLAAASALATALWPLISIAATGENAFFISRASYSSESFLGQWITYGFDVSAAYPFTPIFIAGIFVLWAGLQLRNKHLPPILREWTPLLALFILAVTGPYGNEYRYLMLGLFVLPLGPMPPAGAKRWAWVTCLLLLVAFALWLQHHWVNVHWVSTEGELRKSV